MAVTGYLMFGDSVSGEVGAFHLVFLRTPTIPQISMDLLKTDGYNKPLNHFALWMLVLSPL
jgi:hypothetical protein